MGRFNSARLISLTAAILMIAAVACSSGSKDNQADTAATATPVPLTEAQVTATAVVAVEQATGAALFLEMISPESDELFVSQNSFEFKGRTTVDALLSVNDTVVDVDEFGQFAVSMDLEEGPNVIEVVASNAAGQQFDEVLLVFYEPV